MPCKCTFYPRGGGAGGSSESRPSVFQRPYPRRGNYGALGGAGSSAEHSLASINSLARFTPLPTAPDTLPYMLMSYVADFWQTQLRTHVVTAVCSPPKVSRPLGFNEMKTNASIKYKEGVGLNGKRGQTRLLLQCKLHPSSCACICAMKPTNIPLEKRYPHEEFTGSEVDFTMSMCGTILADAGNGRPKPCPSCGTKEFFEFNPGKFMCANDVKISMQCLHFGASSQSSSGRSHPACGVKIESLKVRPAVEKHAAILIGVCGLCNKSINKDFAGVGTTTDLRRNTTTDLRRKCVFYERLAASKIDQLNDVGQEFHEFMESKEGLNPPVDNDQVVGDHLEMESLSGLSRTSTGITSMTNGTQSTMSIENFEHKLLELDRYAVKSIREGKIFQHRRTTGAYCLATMDPETERAQALTKAGVKRGLPPSQMYWSHGHLFPERQVARKRPGSSM